MSLILKLLLWRTVCANRFNYSYPAAEAGGSALGNDNAAELPTGWDHNGRRAPLPADSAFGSSAPPPFRFNGINGTDGRPLTNSDVLADRSQVRAACARGGGGLTAGNNTLTSTAGWPQIVVLAVHHQRAGRLPHARLPRHARPAAGERPRHPRGQRHHQLR
jgi:hypothetical protein